MHLLILRPLPTVLRSSSDEPSRMAGSLDKSYGFVSPMGWHTSQGDKPTLANAGQFL